MMFTKLKPSTINTWLLPVSLREMVRKEMRSYFKVWPQPYNPQFDMFLFKLSSKFLFRKETCGRNCPACIDLPGDNKEDTVYKWSKNHPENLYWIPFR